MKNDQQGEHVGEQIMKRMKTMEASEGLGNYYLGFFILVGVT